MLTPAQAWAQILERIQPLEQVESVPIAASVGRVLARDVISDVDLPPFEKSAMDGFAVHSADFAAGAERTLQVVGESRAGAPFAGAVPRGACVAIYTGAELPGDCDAVVMVELSRAGASADSIVLRDRPKALQHVCQRGQDVKSGARVLETRRRIRSVDLALLASVGCDPVPVFRRPRVAVLTSGDELVPPSQMPARGQIREGNTLHLSALAAAAGADVVNLGVVRDDPAELARAFGSALERCDALITTGGVSMGKYDLVGAALETVGVEGLFHRVAIKPGKPLWFGARGGVAVFALPGNPVSCLVNHELFVAPALRKLGGERVDNGAGAGFAVGLQRGRWTGGAKEPNTREQYLPVLVHAGDDGVARLAPVKWNGSADVVGISQCDALAVVPIDAPLASGDLLAFRRLG
jgi:molybdopterin molybdotransferase